MGSGSAGPRERVRVLLVEDDPEDLRRLTDALEQAEGTRFEITSATQVEDALRALREGGHDVVLLDLSLPEGAGTDSLARAKLATASVPFVVLTSRDDEAEALRALRFGAQDYVVKGETDPRVLVRAIRHAMERHRLVSDLEASRRREHYLASHDGLTGLVNRLALLDHFKRALAQAVRHGRKLAVFFVDLDRFKNINDSLGHALGDEVLRRVAERLSNCIRRSDLVARLGGDEFVILVQDVSDEIVPARIAEKVLQTLSQPFLLDGQQYRVTASLGLALFPKDGHEPELLIQQADIAMYRAKSEGRNRYYFYTEGMNQGIGERLELENRLRESAERGNFALAFQPQLDLAFGDVVGVEALVRWPQPDGSLVSPDRFVPLAEETGLIVPIGDWVLRAACAEACTWGRPGRSGPGVSVNVSTVQLRGQILADSVESALRETGLEPGRLTLELTESAVMEPEGRTLATLERLRATGVRIAIDDFGTGYSSLAALRTLPADELKIDRSFVTGMVEDMADAAITQSVVTMAGALGLSVVAEGIETADQGELLLRQGCYRMQGYFFAKPCAGAELREQLSLATPPWEAGVEEVRRRAEFEG